MSGPKQRSVSSDLEQAEARLIDFEKDLGTEEGQKANRLHEDYRDKIRARSRGDVQQVIRTVEGRRTMWHILESSWPADMVTFVKGDPYESSFNEGRRYVAIEIMKILAGADAGILVQMQREHASEAKEDEKRRAKLREEVANVG